MLILKATTFLCMVVGITDADTFTCADGTRVRVAAINARERNGSCNHYPCPEMRHQEALPIAKDLLLNKQVRLHVVGQSGKRLVAQVSLPDGSDLGCKLIELGAATDWVEWREEYGLPGCGR